MSHTSPAFAFPAPAEPLVLAAARDLAARLSACQIRCGSRAAKKIACWPVPLPISSTARRSPK